MQHHAICCRLSAGRAGSVTYSARDDGTCEVVAQHEQAITALGEKVATLEDALERLQQGRNAVRGVFPDFEHDPAAANLPHVADC